jgi:hypothetical protein
MRFKGAMARVLSAGVLCRDGFKGVWASGPLHGLEAVRSQHVAGDVIGLMHAGANTRRRTLC